MAFASTSFTISIPQSKLDELQAGISTARLPAPFYEGTRPDLGVTTDWLKEAKQEWQTNFDWRKLEARLNKLNHFIGEVPFKNGTFKIHYVHQKSGSPGAIPLLILHGWPGSFLEFIDVIEPLAAANFNVVVASLPGFAFSQKPPINEDFGRHDVATIMDSLMKSLGYAEYAAQGGDLGSHVARILGSKFSGSCKAVHQNMLYVPLPDSFDSSHLPDDEKEGIQRTKHFFEREFDYGRLHATKPSTLSHALYSSPLALLAWVGEKFLTWTDKTPPVSKILESVTLWYLTDTMPTSIYFYREDKTSPLAYIPVPYGFTWNKKEIFPPPLSLAKTTGNLLWTRKHQIGGHFFAMERPEAYVQDMKDCFEILWRQRDLPA